MGWCITRGQLFEVISRLKRSTYIPQNKVFLFNSGSMAFSAIFCLCLVVPEIDFQGWLIVQNWCLKPLTELSDVSCCLIWKIADLYESSLLFLSYCGCCRSVLSLVGDRAIGIVWVCGQFKDIEGVSHPLNESLFSFSFQLGITNGQQTLNEIVLQMSIYDNYVNNKKIII